jgi:hypothetical protein
LQISPSFSKSKRTSSSRSFCQEKRGICSKCFSSIRGKSKRHLDFMFYILCIFNIKNKFMKIIAFGASTSNNSINNLATYAASLFENATVEVLDLTDFEMPLLMSISNDN